LKCFLRYKDTNFSQLQFMAYHPLSQWCNAVAVKHKTTLLLLVCLRTIFDTSVAELEIMLLFIICVYKGIGQDSVVVGYEISL
jgi:hypothetical protein